MRPSTCVTTCPWSSSRWAAGSSCCTELAGCGRLKQPPPATHRRAHPPAPTRHPTRAPSAQLQTPADAQGCFPPHTTNHPACLACLARVQIFFWKFRQAEQEGYALQYSPLRVRQGDLTDPLFLDFISFAQFAVAGREMPRGQQVFKVCGAAEACAAPSCSVQLAPPQPASACKRPARSCCAAPRAPPSVTCTHAALAPAPTAPEWVALLGPPVQPLLQLPCPTWRSP